MKYSIIIPTYNRCDKFLKPCIQSILDYSVVEDLEIIISANGCTDNTFEYYGSLKEKFNYLGLNDNLKIVWSDKALGYPKAVNEGIKISSCDKVVLFNNDATILPSPRNTWLNYLLQPFNDPVVGITSSLQKYSDITQSRFCIFFCAMIDIKVFEKIGLLDEDFGIGSNEDIDFCKRAENAGFKLSETLDNKRWSHELNMHTGNFPIYHPGEGTVHDTELVQGWNDNFYRNELKLALKHNNIEWYNAAITKEPYNKLV